MSMTVLKYTILPCLTLHGLEQTIKAVDRMLQGHDIGLGIIPSNVDNDAVVTFALHLVNRDSDSWIVASIHCSVIKHSRRCIDYKERLCRIKDSDIAMIYTCSPLPHPSQVASNFIQSTYSDAYIAILISKHHNKLKLNVECSVNRAKLKEQKRMLTPLAVGIFSRPGWEKRLAQQKSYISLNESFQDSWHESA
ncbi:hypothetical protein BDP27DRAFT_1369848 [Rhodocollybia butyracea]|uniref:Uncharacterized protein n=1 Tax=Rhodocollybia butyracea TaxID=206335 RepID=A0A9P5TZW4_9AGAR|nr:hypothetical protein BDP27DRAFT_1369848 [Rhodocollybia butyracea]